MANKKKDVVINVNPFHCEIYFNNKGFTLEFWDKVGDDYSRRKKVRLHFDDWWLKVIARMLWKVISRRKEEVAELENGMKE